MINILEDVLGNRKQRIVLNNRFSYWVDVRAGAPQVSILGLLLFLVYVNDLSNDIKSKYKLFADNTSLFSVVHDIDTSANNLNHDLGKISEWPISEWKMNFNPDPTKQAQEIIFSGKKNCFYPPSCLFQ